MDTQGAVFERHEQCFLPMAHQGSNAMINTCYDDVSGLQSNGNDGSNENHVDDIEAIRKIKIANQTKYTMLDSGIGRYCLVLGMGPSYVCCVY